VSAAESGAPLARFLAGPPPPDVRAALERLARAGDVRRVAVMPDVHLARDVCVGVALATTRRIYPAAVGDDIGCGMAALHLGCEAGRLDEGRAQALLGDLRRAVPTLRQHGTGDFALPAGLAERTLTLPALESEKRFVELQTDAEGALWLMLPSGSRSMGQSVRLRHEARAQDRDGGLAWFDAEDEAGRAYLADMAWALDFAEANRRRILERVAALAEHHLGAQPDGATLVTCNHNHVRRERLGEEDLWVHRKGAIPARAGEPGIIPGSMGAASYHVEGRGCAEALHSSSHGAGRAMSRSEARQRISLRTLERELRDVWYDRRLAPRLRDEAPGAYKEIGAVMRAQRELTRIVRRLRPLLSYKGV